MVLRPTSFGTEAALLQPPLPDLFSLILSPLSQAFMLSYQPAPEMYAILSAAKEPGCIHAQHIRDELGQDRQYDDRIEPIDLVAACMELGETTPF